MPLLKGKKVTLRPYQMSDAQILYDSLDDPMLKRLTGTHAVYTLEQVERYIANFETATDRVGFIIANPEDLTPYGEVVILDINEDNRNAGIRIAMYDMAHVNKGYGSEAMRLAVGYGFTELKLHRIMLEVFDFNDRAQHVYEKVGFKREGVQRDGLFWDGEFHDTIMMAILEDEWDS